MSGLVFFLMVVSACVGIVLACCVADDEDF
jgi:hypothetical protein